MTQRERAGRRSLIILILMVAGEGAFLLPFVVARVFRPTMLEVFGITNLELGTAFSLYGIVAMVSYLAGGPLADRYPARRLMAAALLATGSGGIVLAGIPSPGAMNVLWAFWGCTSILLFWAAMIRAAREWGGASMQGRAYGLLDGGRGLIGALVASLAVAVFALLLPGDASASTPEERESAFRAVIWVFTALTLAGAAAVWIIIPDNRPVAQSGAAPPLDRQRQGAAPAGAALPSPSVPAETAAGHRPRDSTPAAGGRWPALRGVMAAMRMPTVWLQGVIVVCSYTAYKATDDFSLLARDALGYGDVAASGIGAMSLWIRAVAAAAAGFLGDRIDASRVVVLSFAALIVSCGLIAVGVLTPGPAWMLIVTIAMASAGIYALRGVYFALLAEGAVPLAFTGSATGIVSVAGFTPDIFMGPLMGVLLDRSPGVAGHQHVFAVVVAFGVVGLLASLAFRRVARRQRAGS